MFNYSYITILNIYLCNLNSFCLTYFNFKRLPNDSLQSQVCEQLLIDADAATAAENGKHV
jgi:hypothetical protein